MSSHRNALPPQSMLLWYAIERVLGQGAFGVTYLAQDTNLHRPVAIKEYLPSQLSFREGDGSVLAMSDDLQDEYSAGLRRFVAEARTLAKFEHPAIVRVHNVFEANRTAYMVMQYEQGEDLGQVLKRRRTLHEDEVLQLLHPLLAGLEVVHTQGFVHRDIKPGNIFIRRDGTPVLLDFGSAREAMDGVSRTLTNFVSPGYAPIEQYASRSDAQGPWSDIYGLAATAYRAMTGRAPIDAVERSNALAQETHDSYQAAQGSYSAALLAAIDHALAFRAQDRPQTVAAWRSELPPPPATFAPDGLFAARAAAAPVLTIDPALGGPTLMVTLPGTAVPRTEVVSLSDIGPAAVRAVPRPGPATAAAVPVSATGATDAASAPAVPPTDTHLATTVRRTMTQEAGAAPARKAFGAKHYAGAIGGLALVALFGGSWLGRSMSAGTPPTTLPAPAPSAAMAPTSSVSPVTDLTTVAPPAETPDATATAMPPAPVASVSPEQQRIDRIADLLYQASLDLDALRLTSPAGQNAYEKYREILALEPEHGPALRGIEAISDRYVGLVYRDLDQRSFTRADSYLRKAETLSPGRPAVVEARNALTAEQLAAAQPPPPVTPTTAAAPAALPAAPPPPSRMESFRQRFDAFVREQRAAQRAQRRDSRGDQLRHRLGGGAR